MNEVEKKLIMELLFNKFEETKDTSILKLIEKVSRSNFIAQHLRLVNVKINVEIKSDKKQPIIDFNELYFNTLDLSGTCLKIENNNISIEN